MSSPSYTVGALLLVAGMLVARTQTPSDLIIFDEDDPIGLGYYDASFGFATVPSSVTGAGPGHDKLVILSDQAATGDHSGALEWRSAPGGNWTFFIASPGWQTRDASGYLDLTLMVNGPEAIPATQLPAVGLESSINVRTPTTGLSQYLTGGLDDDPETWQSVRIPLTAFQPFGGFSLAQFKDVNFSQSADDNLLNTLWFDDVRLSAGGSSTNRPPPSAPTGLITQSGDQSVLLHWNPSPDLQLAGYEIYRADSSGGPFAKVNSATVVSPAYADNQVQNGPAYFYRIHAINTDGIESTNSVDAAAAARPFENDQQFLDFLQYAAFQYFWREANPTNGLVRDRSQPFSVASIAATGFGLTAVGIGVDHGWISREQGRERALKTMQTFWEKPQGLNPTNTIGYQGWFYHFLESNTGLRAGSSELSTIDTALLMAGILYAKQFFDEPTPDETDIRTLADEIFKRVDWLFMTTGSDSLAMGWYPDTGFIEADWIGYNEASLLYLLGLGAEQPIAPVQWTSWTSGYDWATHDGLSFVEFPPLFGHQYSQCWIDFRHVADPYMAQHGLTYFENSRRATLAQRAYCIANPGGFPGYGENQWGLTACDGPGSAGYFSYIARGAPPAENDDGTIAPTAVGGSLPFAPEYCLPVLLHLYAEYRTNLWTGYGFRDAFNLQAEWWSPDILGIDQGPILIMAENYRSQSVWRTFMREPAIQRGLEAAGFVRIPSVKASAKVDPLPAAVTLSWPASTDRAYQVEYSPDFLQWQISPTGRLNAEGPEAAWIDDGPPATESAPADVSQRYYRVFDLGAPNP